MSLRDTLAGLLNSPGTSLEISPPRRIGGSVASASPLVFNLPLTGPVGDPIVRGNAFYFEAINGFLAPSASVTITDLSLSLSNNGGNILALLGQPILTTLSPASETSLYFPTPAMVTLEDLIQWGALSSINLAQPFQLRIRLAWTAPAVNISLRLQAKYRIVSGQQEG